MKKILNDKINILNLSNDILVKLNKNNINTVIELCKLNRKKLKDYNFTLEEIKEITIKLQLNGLDLSKKYKI
ncbi:MAG: hypothetical protein IJ094_08500 [Bacilli bacterium]|nr:hypothetical protein [Bacilli bacterium]